MNEYVGAARPRVLAIGLTDAEIELIRPLAGSLTIAAGMSTVHPEEHDVLIHTESDFSDGAGLFGRRIVFASPALSDLPRIASSSGSVLGSSYHPSTRSTTQFRPARNLEITQFARDQGLESLVRLSCWPAQNANYSGFGTPVRPERIEHVLLRERLEYPYAMAAILETADEDETPDSAYWLPAIARTEIESWVRVAFTRWRLTAPEVFPETAEWRKSDEWASPAELTARQELASFETEEARHQAQAVIVREQLSRRVRATDSEGEAWRALVSSTGEDLVQAVNKTLQMIGFQVIDSDTLPQHKGKKREDLRVVDGDWTALVEVKGYGGAAKSNDLQQLTAASTVFAAAERKVPDALWYVVNVHRFIDPAQRELALPSREDDLAAFAESHSGALIDVRDLFKLRQLVAAQTMSPTEARNRLKDAIRRFRPLNPMSSEDTEG